MSAELIDRELAIAPAIAQRFQSNVEPELVAELEAVHDRSRCTEDRDIHTVDALALNAFGQCYKSDIRTTRIAGLSMRGAARLFAMAIQTSKGAWVPISWNRSAERAP